MRGNTTVVLAALLLCAPAADAARSGKVMSRGVYLQAGIEAIDKAQYTAAINNLSKAVQTRGDAASYFLLGYAYYLRGFAAGSPETADKQDALEAINAYAMALAV